MPTEYRIFPGQGAAALVTRAVDSLPLQPDQVRIAVKAVSLNARDGLIVDGLYPVSREIDRVPCSDGAGVIVEVGSAVKSRKVGDRVVGSFFRDWLEGAPTEDSILNSYGCELDGWLASEVCLPERAVVPIPDELSFSDAACAPCAGVTAWQALFGDVKLSPGSTVAATGTGGVAMWAALLAGAAGHDCILTSSSDAKLAALAGPRTQGVNYAATPDWAAQVRARTGGRGADLVLDLGGEKTIAQSLDACAYGGEVAVIGGTTGWVYQSLQPLALIRKKLTLRGIYVGSAGDLRDLMAFIVRHNVRPAVGAVFGFEDAQAAFEALARREHAGKIVIAAR